MNNGLIKLNGDGEILFDSVENEYLKIKDVRPYVATNNPANDRDKIEQQKIFLNHRESFLKPKSANMQAETVKVLGGIGIGLYFKNESTPFKNETAV